MSPACKENLSEAAGNDIDKRLRAYSFNFRTFPIIMSSLYKVHALMCIFYGLHDYAAFSKVSTKATTLGVL
jgi:hypothetical protein